MGPGVERCGIARTPPTHTPLHPPLAVHPSPPPLPPRPCRIYGSQITGVSISGAGTRGRLERCDVSANLLANVGISGGADPTLAACK